MTTNHAALRAGAVPAVLVTAAVAFFLTNESTSAETVRAVAGTVAGWPAWAHEAVALVSEGGLVLLALLFGAAAWRGRARGERHVATVVVGGLGVGVALGASELLKASFAQDRPCRAVPGVQSLGDCPPVGDWSLPSNHATLAAALAAALIWTAPRWWPAAAALALPVAAARVALGVHQPHDVVDGLVLGAVVVSALVVLLRRPAVRGVARATRVPVLRLVLATTDPRADRGRRT